MKVSLCLFLVVFVGIDARTMEGQCGQPPSVMKNFSLGAYMGSWYEVNDRMCSIFFLLSVHWISFLFKRFCGMMTNIPLSMSVFNSHTLELRVTLSTRNWNCKHLLITMWTSRYTLALLNNFRVEILPLEQMQILQIIMFILPIMKATHLFGIALMWTQRITISECGTSPDNRIRTVNRMKWNVWCKHTLISRTLG